MQKKLEPSRYAIEPLEPRKLLAGVTLITHGFNDNANGWVGSMAAAIAGKQSIDAPIYLLNATDHGVGSNPISVTLNQSPDGPLPSAINTHNPEIILILDWSDMAGSISLNSHSRTTVAVAQAVSTALLQPGLLSELGANHALAELPIHLIGHSRGGSLVSDLAKDLGQQGVWVDQLTLLDPVAAFSGDAIPQVSSNTSFVDDYYQNSDPSLIARGAVVSGADLVGPLSLPGGGTGFGGDHNDVHTWYHGTINTSVTSDGSVSFNPSDWYTANSVDRSQNGYYYSRVAGGTRPQDYIPIAIGGTQARSFGATAGSWPNIGYLNREESSNSFTLGQTLHLDYKYQDYDSATDALFYLDVDQNPYNNNFASADPSYGGAAFDPIDRGYISRSSTGDSVGSLTGADLHTGGALTLNQNYYVCAKIQDGTNARYSYLSTPISFTAAPAVSTITSVSPSSLPALNTPQAVAIFGTGFTGASILRFHDPQGTSYDRTPSSWSSTRLDYNLNVAADVGQWTVQVIDGANTSNTATFSVVSQPVITSVSPSTLAPVSLPQTQLLTINGGGFLSTSILHFTDTFGNTYDRNPSSANATQLQYNIKVGTDQGQWTVTVRNGGVESNSTSFYVTNASPVVTPTISPAGGTYSGSVQVTLSPNTPDSLIRYTLDGTNPTINSTSYSVPFTLNNSATVKARGFKAGLPDSAVASIDFVVTAAPTQVATPVLSPNGGTFNPSVQVSISSTPGAIIRYTTDTTDPKQGNGTVYTYTGPFTLNATTTVRTYATKSGLQDSGVNNVTFQVYSPTTPLLSVDATNFNVGPNNGQIQIHLRNGGGGNMSYDAYSWGADSWLYASSNGSSTGPQDDKFFRVNFDTNTTGATRVGHVTINSGQTTQGAPLTITITQNTTPDIDLATSDIFFTDSEYGESRITAPQVGQQVYVRYSLVSSGQNEVLDWLIPFPNRSPNHTVSIDGTTIGTGASGAIVPSTWVIPGVPWTVTAGTHTITVAADTSNTVPETSEGNNQTSLTFTAVTAPTLAIGNVTIVEGDTGTNDAVFTVSLSHSWWQSISVNYGSADGTASSSTDYTTTTGSLTFVTGELTKTIAVPVIGDLNGEPDETFYVNLSNPSNATIAAGQGTATILDDGPKVVYSGFDYQIAQTISIGFDKDLGGLPPTPALTVTNLTTGLSYTPSSIWYSPVLRTLNAVFSSLLPNGNYQATLAAGSTTDSSGNQLAAPSTFNFFALAGDANHDAKVDIIDLYMLASNFQGNGKTFSQGDFNYDGTVNAADLGILAGNWQRTPSGALASSGAMPAIIPPPPVVPPTRAPARKPVRAAVLT